MKLVCSRCEMTSVHACVILSSSYFYLCSATVIISQHWHRNLSAMNELYTRCYVGTSARLCAVSLVSQPDSVMHRCRDRMGHGSRRRRPVCTVDGTRRAHYTVHWNQNKPVSIPTDRGSQTKGTVKEARQLCLDVWTCQTFVSDIMANDQAT